MKKKVKCDDPMSLIITIFGIVGLIVLALNTITGDSMWLNVFMVIIIIAGIAYTIYEVIVYSKKKP